MSVTTTRKHLDTRPARNWPRIVLIALVAPVIAIGVLFAGPLMALFVVAVVVPLDWLLGRKRRAELRQRARERRRELLEQAIAAGGPSDEPAEGRGKTDLASVRREWGGEKRFRNYYGWPRGHI